MLHLYQNIKFPLDYQCKVLHVVCNKILTIYKLLDYFLGGWPAISTFYIVLYGLLFINHTNLAFLCKNLDYKPYSIINHIIFFSFIFPYQWLMSNKLIFIVIVIVTHITIQHLGSPITHQTFRHHSFTLFSTP